MQETYNAGDGLNMPYSLEAEQAVLGAVLIDPSSLNSVADKLIPEHFYLPEHQAIYRVMVEKMNLNQTVDFVTVLEALKQTSFFEEKDGKTYLFKLTQMVPSVANIDRYAVIIREKYDVRMLITAAREILTDAMDAGTEADQLLDQAEQKIFSIRQGRYNGGLTPISEVIASNYELFNSMQDPEKRELFVGIPTGISDLDAITTGLNRSDLIIIGARPGMGKTTFTLNVARNVAVQQGRTVAFFNLEMSKEQMVNRLLSAEALVSGKKLRTGNLSAPEWSRIAVAASTLCKAPIYLDDTPSITAQEMKARLRRIDNLGAVFVDYLQLMRSAKKTENRVQEVSEITRSLKIMAKELNVPVIVCAQLARSIEKQANHRPGLSDLRESGSIEQDADQVLFLYRDEYYKDQQQDPTQVEVGTSEVIVAKNRHGELGTAKLAFSGEFTQFTGLEQKYNEPA